MTAYQTPQDRAFNISQGTGVPTPYKVAASFETQSPYKVEQKIHALLNDYRLRSEREFFKLELEAAIEIIKQHIIKIKPPKATIEKEINSASQKIIIDKKIQLTKAQELELKVVKNAYAQGQQLTKRYLVNFLVLTM